MIILIDSKYADQKNLHENRVSHEVVNMIRFYKYRSYSTFEYFPIILSHHTTPTRLKNYVSSIIKK